MYKESQVAINTRHDWGLLEIKGSDRSRFLHNQTTNDILSLQTGQTCDTVFVNSIGRTLDLATVLVTPEAILILISPNRREFLLNWMDRYIFPMDQVELTDISRDYAIFSLIGPASQSLLTELGLENPPPSQEHQIWNYLNTSIYLASGCGLAIPGYTLLVPIEASQRVWQALIQLNTQILTESDWEHLRILQGRPIPDQELTEDYNPLEAGLWQSISFNKGCYIGQETIARLNTYQGVKQRLWGIRLENPVAPGTIITIADKKVGKLTSCSGNFGLAYIRTQAGGEGLQVQLGDTQGQVVPVAFLTHEYYR
ncbi:folate-binding protein YgfZ [Gloeocapsa sp. PCC 73106]|uniref:CAF17-like 4Fe-4S cluster assembly/insertion protein YgfZ n=1 Tax=Gloeocapsa sp. PCC 73106 TaxID=102232 RepID=UPI0002AC3AAD|nr:folate-binding protein YgfZ [Gloeocapsa sp. PCC 73106]ELR98599.1 folate-binding protein YgfZ [Gloeocapsa sp. PCC 73106]